MTNNKKGFWYSARDEGKQLTSLIDTRKPLTKQQQVLFIGALIVYQNCF